jgi:hypothetical protein
MFLTLRRPIRRAPTGRCVFFCWVALGRRPKLYSHQLFLEREMGKYFLAWILGVPAVVLVGIYLVAHL